MTIPTLIRYLFGDRDAILKIGSTPAALWVGMVFVFSAAFAREYDGADLVNEPWHLVVPLLASLGTSLILFCLVFAIAWERGVNAGLFWSGYRSFLTLYWMTAPLAWLYAIPVERFLSPGDATRANLWLLFIVAMWRVLLMIRVVTVLFGAKLWSAVVTVMLFADSVALVVLAVMPRPIVQFMGGIRFSESEALIQVTVFRIAVLGVITWPVWLMSAAGVLYKSEPKWTYNLVDLPAAKLRWSILVLAAISIAVWFAVLPMTQPEQHRRHTAEWMLRSGEVEEAVRFMSEHERSEFPPHWDVPPRIAYGEDVPSMLDVMDAVLEDDTAPWVREIYLGRFRNYIYDSFARSTLHSPESLVRRVRILHRIPNGRTLLDDEFTHRYLLGFADAYPEYADDIRVLFPDKFADHDGISDEPGRDEEPNSSENPDAEESSE